MLLHLQPAGDVGLNELEGRSGPNATDDGHIDGGRGRGRWGRGIGLVLMLPIGLIVIMALAIIFGGREGMGVWWLVIVIAVFLVLLVVRISFRRSRRRYWMQHQRQDRPMMILRERYARG